MKQTLFSASGRLPFLRSVRTLTIGLIIAAGLSVAGCSDSDYEIYATLHGTITDYQTGLPLENADVILSPSSATKHTASDGKYIFTDLDAQQYTIIVQKAGYMANRKIVNAVSGENTEVNIALTKITQ